MSTGIGTLSKRLYPHVLEEAAMPRAKAVPTRRTKREKRTAEPKDAGKPLEEVGAVAAPQVSAGRPPQARIRTRNVWRTRLGRGFSMAELRAVQLAPRDARRGGLRVDALRRTTHEENVALLRDWLKARAP